MPPVELKILYIQLACLLFLDFVPLVILGVLFLQGKATFSLFTSNEFNKPTLFEAEQEPGNHKRQLMDTQEPIKLSSIRLANSAIEDESLYETSIKEIELRAMELVRQYELSQGKEIEDVSMYYTGYDFKSYEGDLFRAIEVKGKATSGNIILTANEWYKAQEYSDFYYLYIVENISTGKPRLKIIQNPFDKMRAEVNKIQFVLSRAEYLSSACEIIDFK